MNNILKIILISLLLITGVIFLTISPFSKKTQLVIQESPLVLKQPSIEPQPIPFEFIPPPDSISQPLLSLEPIPQPPSVEFIPQKNIKENINNIKSYTDLITDILQKIFGTITSGLGIFLAIKELKQKKIKV